MDDRPVDRVLGMGAATLAVAEDRGDVRLVVTDERLRGSLGKQVDDADVRLRGPEGDRPRRCITQDLDHGRAVVTSPGPGVAEPELWHQVERRRLGSVVRRLKGDADVPRCGLGMCRDDVEEAVLVEDTRVDELELGLIVPARRVLLAQRGIRVGGLRVAVEVLRPAVGGGRVEVPPVLLGVLTVVALAVGEAEVALLEAVVVPVPHRDGEVEEAVAVAQPGDAVLTPAVGTRVRVVEREERPGPAVGRVVLTHRPPLPARDVGAPGPPRVAVVGRLLESAVLLGLGVLTRLDRRHGLHFCRRMRGSDQ